MSLRFLAVTYEFRLLAKFLIIGDLLSYMDNQKLRFAPSHFFRCQTVKTLWSYRINQYAGSCVEIICIFFFKRLDIRFKFFLDRPLWPNDISLRQFIIIID